MDFDEYDYLEKTADDSELPKDQPPPPAGNGSRSDEKDRTRSRSSRHRETDTERDPTHRSKRSRPEDEGTRDPERHRERSSSRHHEDRERERHRSGRDSRDERNGKERERERHERDRGKERDRERGEERPRHHSRSRPDRRQEEESAERVKEIVPREKEKEKEREPREPREKDHNSRRYKEKKDEVAEPEADPERDQRTVFAYQIALKADERDVYEFFSRAGKVRDVRLIMDRNSRRSKGVGYIEFYESLSVPMAIALSGQLLFGQPVMVKPSEAEKNLVQSNTAAGGLVGPYSGGARRLYIGNLHFNITEEQLRLVLEPFGQVELVQLPRELETGHCKGYGFVQFARLEDARAALSLNGQLEIAGRVIKVSAVTDQVGMLDVGTNIGDFYNYKGGGLYLNAYFRDMLLQKLDCTGAATSLTGALVPPTASPLL